MKLLILLLLPISAFAQDWGRYATQPVPPPQVPIVAPVLPYIAPPIVQAPINFFAVYRGKNFETTTETYKWLTREPPQPTIKGKP